MDFWLILAEDISFELAVFLLLVVIMALGWVTFVVIVGGLASGAGMAAASTAARCVAMDGVASCRTVCDAEISTKVLVLVGPVLDTRCLPAMKALTVSL